MTKRRDQSEAELDRQEWIDLVGELSREVETWAKERNWLVHREDKTAQESRLGEYRVPVLTVRAPDGVVHVEPVARDVAGAAGRVDLLAWPSLTRMMLVRIGGNWVLKTDSGLEWPEGWSRQTFERLVAVLNAAA